MRLLWRPNESHRRRKAEGWQPGGQADGDDDGFISWQSGAAALHLSRRPATGVARRVQLVGRADEMKMRAADGMKKV